MERRRATLIGRHSFPSLKHFNYIRSTMLALCDNGVAVARPIFGCHIQTGPLPVCEPRSTSMRTSARAGPGGAINARSVIASIETKRISLLPTQRETEPAPLRRCEEARHRGGTLMARVRVGAQEGRRRAHTRNMRRRANCFGISERCRARRPTLPRARRRTAPRGRPARAPR